MEQTSLATGHEGTMRDQISSYFNRVRGGEMGALPAIAGLVTLSILFAFASPSFLTPLNFANLFVQAAELTILASALVFVLLLAEIDLSAGVTAGVAMAIFYVLSHGGMNWILALLIGFAFGAFTGFTLGFFVARIGVPSFVVTLGFYLGFQGLQVVILHAGGQLRVEIPAIQAIMNESLPAINGWIFLIVSVIFTTILGLWDRSRRARAGLTNRPIGLLILKIGSMIVIGSGVISVLNMNRSQSDIKIIAGVPIVIPITVVVLAIGTFFLDRTRFGRHLYAVGGNAEAARRAGIKVARVRITAFIITSTLACLSGLLHVSRLGGVEATAGRQIVLSGVAAAVVGGVSLFGGRGRLANAAIGALVIAIIENGLGLLEFPAGVNLLVTGAVLTLAATIDALSRKRSGAGTVRA